MILSAHNPIWFSEFESLRAVYASALGNLVERIEHVGSTSVPDLYAKPILDIDIVMPDYGVFPQITEALGRLGYRHNGDQGIRHREAFNPTDGFVPHVPPQREWMLHHLYVCPAYSEELHRHILFRDALRTHAHWRQEYEAIKQSIAARSNDDRKTYANIKEAECREFVERVLMQSSKQVDNAKPE